MAAWRVRPGPAHRWNAVLWYAAKARGNSNRSVLAQTWHCGAGCTTSSHPVGAKRGPQQPRCGRTLRGHFAGIVCVSAHLPRSESDAAAVASQATDRYVRFRCELDARKCSSSLPRRGIADNPEGYNHMVGVGRLLMRAAGRSELRNLKGMTCMSDCIALGQDLCVSALWLRGHFCVQA